MYLGLVRPGDRVLSARQQAERLKVDPRVVMAAYRELEREGLVVRRERVGVFLADTADVPGASEERLSEWTAEVLLQGLARGIRVRDLPAWFGRAVGAVRLRAVCIECNEDQLHALCEELAEDYGFETDPLDLERARRPGAKERRALRSADLLVTTSSHAREVARLAAAHGRACAAVDINPEWAREVSELLARGPVHVVATDPRLAKKLRALFLRAQGASNLHFTILGKNDPTRIPPGSSVLVTRRAQLRYEPQPSFRVLGEQRIFALDSARTLLHHLVRENVRRAASA